MHVIMLAKVKKTTNKEIDQTSQITISLNTVLQIGRLLNLTTF